MSDTPLTSCDAAEAANSSESSPSMPENRQKPAWVRQAGLVAGSVALGVLLGTGVQSLARWSGWSRAVPGVAEVARSSGNAADHDHGGAADHDHDLPHGHNADEEASAVYLTAEAQRSVGIEIGQVQLGPYEQTTRVPGLIAELPGRSKIEVPAPLTGVVTKIFVVEGQAIEPGQPLCEVRLTQEDLVQTQADFLRKIESLDVIQREITRLESVAEEGVIARKSLLAAQYQQQQLEAELRAQSQALLLHGLSQDQVAQIRADRRLLGTLTLLSPRPESIADGGPTLLVVERLKITSGQSVTAGTCLVDLADHRHLAVEGRAFEQDLPALESLAEKGWHLSIVIEGEGRPPQTVAGLALSHLAGQIEPDSRTMRFFVSLSNEIVRDSTNPDGRRVIDWRFRPGQRVQVLIPVERWESRLVLPLEAVASEGAENYVFLEDQGHFHRLAVAVEHRDPLSVVIAAGGGLKPGDSVALSGAHQLLLTWKNRLSGGGEPHHDHEH